jgi:hypothetical protein
VLARAEPARVDAATWPDRLAIEILYNRSAQTLPNSFAAHSKHFRPIARSPQLHRSGSAPFAMVRVFVTSQIYRRFPRRAIEHQQLLRLPFSTRRLLRNTCTSA